MMDKKRKGNIKYLREILNFSLGMRILKCPLVDMSTMQLKIKDNQY